MNKNIVDISLIVNKMDEHLRDILLLKNGKVQYNKLWENTYVKRQIDRRNNGHIDFSIQEHIKAMVYSMLSSNMSWECIEKNGGGVSETIISIDEIFHQYNPEYLLSCIEDEIVDKIKKIKCGSYNTRKQMKGLIHTNIGKMIKLQKKYGSIDRYYQRFIEIDDSMKLLVRNLSCPYSQDKYIQMGEALIAEYLRNVGYDIAKPDRHICRILGKEYLNCSEQKEVTAYEAFDLVRELSESMGRKTVAEVDYILWSYCADGYGAICKKNFPKCKNCVAKEICNSKKGD